MPLGQHPFLSRSRQDQRRIARPRHPPEPHHARHNLLCNNQRILYEIHAAQAQVASAAVLPVQRLVTLRQPALLLLDLRSKLACLGLRILAQLERLLLRFQDSRLCLLLAPLDNRFRFALRLFWIESWTSLRLARRFSTGSLRPLGDPRRIPDLHQKETRRALSGREPFCHVHEMRNG